MNQHVQVYWKQGVTFGYHIWRFRWMSLHKTPEWNILQAVQKFNLAMRPNALDFFLSKITIE